MIAARFDYDTFIVDPSACTYRVPASLVADDEPDERGTFYRYAYAPISDLGALGWELVTVTAMTDSDDDSVFIGWFKRLKGVE